MCWQRQKKKGRFFFFFSDPPSDLTVSEGGVNHRLACLSTLCHSGAPSQGGEKTLKHTAVHSHRNCQAATTTAKLRRRLGTHAHSALCQTRLTTSEQPGFLWFALAIQVDPIYHQISFFFFKQMHKTFTTLKT